MAEQGLFAASTKIVRVSTNYMAYVKDPANPPKEPTLFLKPTSSFLHADAGGASTPVIEVPEPLESLRHEVELATFRRNPPWTLLEVYALALDMTAKEIQTAAKSAGLPWALAKGQDTFTPISAVVSNWFSHNQYEVPKSAVSNPDDLEIWLKVDDELRQKVSASDMIFNIPFLVSYISSIMTLMEGDVILTGTPAGVGPARVGQKIKKLELLALLMWSLMFGGARGHRFLPDAISKSPVVVDA